MKGDDVIDTGARVRAATIKVCSSFVGLRLANKATSGYNVTPPVTGTFNNNKKY